MVMRKRQEGRRKLGYGDNRGRNLFFTGPVGRLIYDYQHGKALAGAKTIFHGLNNIEVLYRHHDSHRTKSRYSY